MSSGRRFKSGSALGGKKFDLALSSLELLKTDICSLNVGVIVSLFYCIIFKLDYFCGEGHLIAFEGR
jgi:hypothetical protein